jgi:hypothetical protein
MSFRDSFFGDTLLSSGPLRISYGDNVLINTIDRGLTAQYKQAEALNERIQSKLAETIERYREASDGSSQMLADEISWQAAQIRQDIAALSRNLAQALDYVAKYLGAGISEARWAVERNTEVTRRILEIELTSHWNESRQFFEEGVQCYDNGERAFAEERFQEAVKACRTNAFAYQYLGFLAAHRDDQTQALRNFDLAAKFAPDDHHRGIAHYHLALAQGASGDGKASLDNAKAAVGCEPDNLVYRYELVCAFVRVGETDNALRELRNVIAADLDYWTRSASDKALDPIRSQLSDLLGTMREERRRTTSHSMERFLETIRLVAGFRDDGLEKLNNSAHATYDSSHALYERGTVFAYRDAAKASKEGNERLVHDAIRLCQDRITSLETDLFRKEAEHKTRVLGLKRQAAELLKQREARLSEATSKELGLRESFKSNNELTGAAVGGLGCLWVIGAVSIMGILGLITREAPPANWAEWFLLIVWGGLSVLAVIALPRWALRKNREVRSVEEIRLRSPRGGAQRWAQAHGAGQCY